MKVIKLSGRDRVSLAFAMGFLFNWSATSCTQDVLGRDRFIEHVRTSWINTPWWMWAALAVVAILIHGLNLHFASRARRAVR
jgi:hypothetical protein